MLSNRTTKHAEMLKREGHRHPITKVLIVFLDVLLEVEDRKAHSEDSERFLAQLAFRKVDREQILKKGRPVFTGQGQFSHHEAEEILRLIGLNEKSIEAFKDYSILLEVFSCNNCTLDSPAEDVIDSFIYFSEEGRSILKQMLNFGKLTLTESYYKYFNIR